MKKANKKFIFVITAFVLFSGSLSGMYVFTDVYDETYSRIVSVLCLSCIKLDPVDTYGWRVNNKPQNFVIDSLDNTGPVFIAYRTDECTYCDIMEPLVMDIFNYSFEKEEIFSTVVDFNGTDITFVHINRDYAKGEFKSSYNKYDVNGDGTVPMFTTITLKYDRGIIKPYYNTVYGLVGKDTDEERKQYLKEIINEAIEFYNANHDGFRPEDFN